MKCSILSTTFGCNG